MASRPRVADIVAAAGLSNDAFYRHFPSKDALVAALLEDGAERLAQYTAHQMSKETSPEDQVRRWVEAVLSPRPAGAVTSSRPAAPSGTAARGTGTPPRRRTRGGPCPERSAPAPTRDRRRPSPAAACAPPSGAPSSRRSTASPGPHARRRAGQPPHRPARRHSARTLPVLRPRRPAPGCGPGPGPLPRRPSPPTPPARPLVKLRVADRLSAAAHDDGQAVRRALRVRSRHHRQLSHAINDSDSLRK
jgi:AcrR family transcriptional regulator